MHIILGWAVLLSGDAHTFYHIFFVFSTQKDSPNHSYVRDWGNLNLRLLYKGIQH